MSREIVKRTRWGKYDGALHGNSSERYDIMYVGTWFSPSDGFEYACLGTVGMREQSRSAYVGNTEGPCKRRYQLLYKSWGRATMVGLYE